MAKDNQSRRACPEASRGDPSLLTSDLTSQGVSVALLLLTSFVVRNLCRKTWGRSGLRKENLLRGGRGKAKPRYARAIRSMQWERCKGKKKALRNREFLLTVAVSFTLAAFHP